MDEFQRLALGRVADAHVLGQVLRLLVDRDLGQEREAGIVGRGVDDHGIARCLDALLVEQPGQRLERIDQGVEGRVPIGGALHDHHFLGLKRELLAEGVGGLDAGGRRRGRRGRGSSAVGASAGDLVSAGGGTGTAGGGVRGRGQPTGSGPERLRVPAIERVRPRQAQAPSGERDEGRTESVDTVHSGILHPTLSWQRRVPIAPAKIVPFLTRRVGFRPMTDASYAPAD